MNSTVKNNYGLDILKILMCFLVTLLHLRPFADYSVSADFFLTNIVTRVAVPTFFALSGYIFYIKGKRFRHYIQRMFVLYLGWTVLYLPQIIIDFHSEKYSCFNFGVKIAIFIRRFFLVSSWTQLWYFIASVYAMIIIWLLQKVLKIKWIFVIGIILCFLFACLEDCYKWIVVKTIPNPQRIYDILEQVRPYVGTIYGGVVEGVMYISGGMLLAKHREAIDRLVKNGLYANGKLYASLIIGFFLLTVETIIDYFLGATSLSLMILIAPVCMILIILFASLEKSLLSQEFSKILRLLSTLIYGFHGIFSFYIQKERVGVDSISFYIIIVLLSVLAGLLTIWVSQTKIGFITKMLM